jgi:hypothetical protein
MVASPAPLEQTARVEEGASRGNSYHSGKPVKTKFTQRRIKAGKASACGLCKPWKQGWADKKTVRDIRHAQCAQHQFREAGF